PADAGAHERRGPRGDDQRGCPARTRYGGHDLVKAVIDGQTGEEGDTKNGGQKGETAHLPANPQTERHKLPHKSSLSAKCAMVSLSWRQLWGGQRCWRRHIRGSPMPSINVSFEG